MTLRLIIAIIILYLLYKVIRVWKGIGGSSRANLPARGEDLVEDPYCKTYIPISDAHRMSIDGKILYFCSEKCLDRYRTERKPQTEGPE